MKLKVPKIPKPPSISPRASAGIAVVLFGVLAVNACTLFAEFPLNGNPLVWLKANDVFKSAQKSKKAADYSTTARQAKEAISIYDHDPRFYLELGHSSMRLGKYADAQQAFEQVTKLNQTDLAAWKGLSQSLAAQDKQEQAMDAVRKALHISPSDPGATALYGLLLATNGQMDEAAKIFDESRSLERDSAEYWNFAGRYFKLLGKPQQTEAAFRQALSKDPSEAEYAEWLGLCLRSMDKTGESEQYLRQATELNPNDANYWGSLAEAQYQQGHIEGAASSLRKALDINPKRADWQRYYGSILYHTEQYPQAERTLAAALNLEYDEVASAYYVNTLCYLHKYDKAAEYLEKRIHDNATPGAYADWIVMGDVRSYQGKTADAEFAYNKALSFKPESRIQKIIEEKLKNPPKATIANDQTKAEQ